MKKNGILNADLARIVASLGHTDKLVICDAGLPIPDGKPIVDLALTANIPRFLETLEVVLEELHVERAIVAGEMETASRSLFSAACDLLEGVRIETIPHSDFKHAMNGDGNVFFVRTGEVSPFANVILVSGVTF